MRTGIHYDRSPRPDFRSFVRQGSTAAISWRGDAGLAMMDGEECGCSSDCGAKEEEAISSTRRADGWSGELEDRSPRPDFSAFVREGSTDAIAWRGDAGPSDSVDHAALAQGYRSAMDPSEWVTTLSGDMDRAQSCGGACDGKCSGGSPTQADPFSQYEVVVGGWEKALVANRDGGSLWPLRPSVDPQARWSDPPPQVGDRPKGAPRGVYNGNSDECDTRLFQLTAEKEKDDPCLPFVGSCGRAPCVDKRGCNLTDDDIRDAERATGFGGPFGDGGLMADDKEVLVTAFAYLQQNADLAKFACCAVFGPGAEVCGCVSDYLDNHGRNLRFERRDIESCTPKKAGDNPPLALGGGADSLVGVCDALFTRYPRTGSKRERRCDFLEIAHFIFHEMMHECKKGHYTDEFLDGGRECPTIGKAQDLWMKGVNARCPGDCPTARIGKLELGDQVFATVSARRVRS